LYPKQFTFECPLMIQPQHFDRNEYNEKINSYPLTTVNKDA